MQSQYNTENRVEELKSEIENLRLKLAARKQEEDSLDKKILEVVIGNIGTGFVVADTNGNILSQNDAALRMHDFRYEHEELKTLSEFTEAFTLEYPEGGKIPLEKWPLTLALKGDYFRDYLVKLVNPKSRSRKVRYISYNTVPIYDKNGVKKFIVMTMSDLSDIRERTEALHESELRYQSLFNNSTIGMAHCNIITDENGKPVDYRIIQINTAYSRISGYKKEEIEGRNATDVYPGIENHPFDFINKYARVALDGEEINEELFDLRFNKWISLYAYSPKFSEFTLMFTDISQRKAIEDKLEKERELFGSIFDNIPVMITIYDPEMKKFRFNKEFKRVLGWTEEDAIDGNLQKKIYPDSVKNSEAEEFMKSTFGTWKELMVVAKDGTEIESEWANIKLSSGIQIRIGIDIRQRKKAEDDLRQSEQRLQSIFGNVAIGIVEVDPEDRIISANDRICHILDYTREELMSKTVHDITFPEDRNLTQYINEKIHKGDYGIIDYEKRYMKKDDTPLWVHVTISGVYDSSGRQINSIGTIEDITERKKVEETLRESESRFRTLADNISQIVWIVDKEGNPVWFNKRWYDFTDVGIEEMRSEGISNLIHPDYLAVFEKFRTSILNGQEWEEIYPMLRKDREYRWFLSRAVPIYDEKGNISMWFGTSTDITEQRKIEEELRESEEKFSTAFKTSPYAIVISRPDDGSIIDVNGAFLRLFDRTEEEILGKTSISIDMFANNEDRQKAIEKLLVDGRVSDLETRIRRKSGEIRTVVMSVEFIYLSGKRALLSTLKDITENKIAEENLRKALHEAEEGRNILNALMNYIPLGILIADAPDVSVRLVSRYGQQMIDRNAEDIIGITAAEHPSKMNILRSDGNPVADTDELPLTRATMKGEIVIDEEWTLVGHDGILTPVVCNAAPILDNSGKIIGGVIAWQDITERKRIMEALKESEARFAAIFKFVPVGIWLSSIADDTIYDANEEFLNLIGLKEKGEVIGKSFYGIGVNFDKEQTRKIREEFEKNKIVRNSELAFQSLTGIRHIVSVNIDVVSIRDNEYMLSTITDITERKRYEVALLRSESILKQAGIMANLGAWEFEFLSEDFSINPLHWSDQVYRIFGYEPGSVEVTNKLFIERVHPDDRARVLESVNLAIKDKKQYTVEHRIVREDGKTRTVIENAEITFSRSGKPLRMIGAVQDITERKIAEVEREKLISQLAFERQRLDTILRRLPAGVMIADDTGKINFANEYTVKLFGPDFMTAGFNTIEKWQPHHPDGTPFKLEELPFVRAFRGLSTEGAEIRLRHKETGNYVYAEINAAPIINDQARIVEEVITLVDITERRRFLEALKENEEKFRSVFENIIESIALHQVIYKDNKPVDFSLIDVNKSFKENFGIDTEAGMGVPLKEKYHSIGLPVMNEYFNVAKDRQPFKFEASVENTGKHFIINVISPKKDQFATVFEDITEQKRNELEIRQKNEELTRFIYTVSHDLKSPLVTIKAFSNYLQEDIENNDLEARERDLNYIRNAADKMGKLLDELLELSRIGRKEKPKEYIPLESIIEAARDLVAGRLEEKKIKVRITGLPVMLYGHGQRFIQLYQNLLDNAAKFMGTQPDPLIEVGAFTDEKNEIVLFVKDNGKGIDPRYHHKIFGLFEKMDNETEGTGIGLALVKRIVEVHGGNIWFTSEGNGTGTTFYFKLSGTSLI
jgi:PAS domain S-box-containing protein